MEKRKAKRPLKICVSGAHGVGKSTLCFQLAHILKQHDINTKVIAENIRGCPFKINQEASIHTELWTFHKTFLDELNAVSERYEAIVCDRGVLDVIAYFSERKEEHSTYFDKIKDLAYFWAVSEYDLIILVEPEDIESKYTADEVRDSDIEYRKRIIYSFREVLGHIGNEILRKKLLIVYSSDIFKSDLSVEKLERRLKLDELI